MLNMIVVGSVLLLTLICWHIILYVPIEIEGSYIKMCISWWSEDLNATHKQIYYLTSDSYISEKYFEKNPDIETDPITYEYRLKYNIQAEDYKALLDYLINSQHFYTRQGAESANHGITEEMEIYHKGVLKHIYFKGAKWEKKMNEGIVPYLTTIVENGTECKVPK